MMPSWCKVYLKRAHTVDHGEMGAGSGTGGGMCIEEWRVLQSADGKERSWELAGLGGASGGKESKERSGQDSEAVSNGRLSPVAGAEQDCCAGHGSADCTPAEISLVPLVRGT